MQTILLYSSHAAASVEQPFRADRDYSAFGPFVFDRQDYDRALEALSEAWDGAV